MADEDRPNNDTAFEAIQIKKEPVTSSSSSSESSEEDDNGVQIDVNDIKDEPMTSEDEHMSTDGESTSDEDEEGDDQDSSSTSGSDDIDVNSISIKTEPMSPAPVQVTEVPEVVLGQVLEQAAAANNAPQVVQAPEQAATVTEVAEAVLGQAPEQAVAANNASQAGQAPEKAAGPGTSDEGGASLDVCEAPVTKPCVNLSQVIIIASGDDDTASPVYGKRRKTGRPKTLPSPATALGLQSDWKTVGAKKKSRGRPCKFDRPMMSRETSLRSDIHKKHNIWVNPGLPISPQLRAALMNKPVVKEEQVSPRTDVILKRSKRGTEEAQGLSTSSKYMLYRLL